MAYVVPFNQFLKSIKNEELRKILSKMRLPDKAFFGDPVWKEGNRVKINAEAKTSEQNIVHIEKKFKVKRGTDGGVQISAGGATVRFIVSGKRAPGSRNALGRALADAGELATVMSLTRDIQTPADTGERIFIENVDAFMAWQNTFKQTRPAVESIVGDLGSFKILHSATDKTGFASVITKFCNKIKVPKDSWNPADIFIVKSTKLNYIIDELNDIVENYEIFDGLSVMFNGKIYEFYTSGFLYPISLKQITSQRPTIELSNEPGKIKASDYDIEISKLNCNLSATGKEIGVLTFKNNDTNKMINMQVRGFPHGYGVSQTEITSDGTATGGRLGKVSTKIMDRILEEFNFERISKVDFFGRGKYFSSFDEKRTDEVYGWYQTVRKHSRVSDNYPLSKEEFTQLIKQAQENGEVAENMCHKIQGLKMMYFFVKNEKNISVVINKLLNGAKKISVDNGFFIKIY